MPAAVNDILTGLRAERHTSVSPTEAGKAPGIPFYTIEVEPGGTIRQHRSYYDEEPGIEEIRVFLKEWQKAIRKRLTEEDKKLAKISKIKREANIAELEEKKNTRVLQGLVEDFLEAEEIEKRTGGGLMELAQYQDYEEYKKAMNTVLNRTVEDFVMTGYLLKQGRDTDILKDSGYSNVNEFAWANINWKLLHRYQDTSGSMTDFRRVVTLRDCRSIIKFGYAKLALMLTLSGKRSRRADTGIQQVRDPGGQRRDRKRREDHRYRSHFGRRERRTERTRQSGKGNPSDLHG